MLSLPRHGSFLIGSLLFALSVAAGPVTTPPPERYSVRAYGAHGDGTALDTAAIQQAIDAAAAAGGGVVFLPPGDYLCTTVHLRSHVTLEIGEGAILRAAEKEKRQPFTPPPAKQGYQTPALIMATGCEQIAIIGRGRIIGEGLVRDTALPPNAADKAIALWQCRDVLLRDITVFRGGHFAIFLTGIDNLAIDHVTVDTERDGIDVEVCRNVRISDCTVNSPFDDGICLKSSAAMTEIRATENVTITGCAVMGYDLGTALDATWQRRTSYTQVPPPDAVGLARIGVQERTRRNAGGPTGRIKFGTSSHGGFKNITIANCTFEYCRGLALEAVDGGDIEDVVVANVTMRDTYTAPIFVRLGARAKGTDGHISAIRRVNLSNITVQSADPRHGCIISGIPGHPIEDLTISHLRIAYPGGGSPVQAARTPAELEADYPEPFMFGDMPAYGLYVRHVRRLTLTDVALTTAQPDARPAIMLLDAQDIQIDNLRADTASEVAIVSAREVVDLRLREVQGLDDHTFAGPETQLLLKRKQATH